jgi:hypothetical protein
VCTADGDCASGICSRNPFLSTDHACTGPCADGCRAGDFCLAALGQCVQSDVGHSCTLSKGGAGAPSICSRVCQGAADCPAGYACSLVGGAHACVNVDATPACAQDTDCWYGTLCEVDRARCLATCRDDLDCPLYHHCLGSTEGLVCVPDASSGRGGVGDPCLSGDDCRAGLCSAGTCVGGCGVTIDVGQWCPGGWGCGPIPSGSGWTLGCLLAGTGEPGAPCVDGRDCASGLCVDQPGYCSRYCNDAPCPSATPICAPAGLMADGVNLLICTR